MLAILALKELLESFEPHQFVIFSPAQITGTFSNIVALDVRIVGRRQGIEDCN